MGETESLSGKCKLHRPHAEHVKQTESPPVPENVANIVKQQVRMKTTLKLPFRSRGLPVLQTSSAGFIYSRVGNQSIRQMLQKPGPSRLFSDSLASVRLFYIAKMFQMLCAVTWLTLRVPPEARRIYYYFHNEVTIRNSTFNWLLSLITESEFILFKNNLILIIFHDLLSPLLSEAVTIYLGSHNYTHNYTPKGQPPHIFPAQVSLVYPTLGFLVCPVFLSQAYNGGSGGCLPTT